MRQLIRKGAALLLGSMVMVGLLGNSGCQETSSRQQNQQVQESLMQRANKAVPVPQLNNFLSREAVAKQIKRLDEKGKLFYVYLLADNGQQIGYYISNTRPVATCTLLTPSEELIVSSYGNSVMRTPGLGGTYSPNPSCNSVFFFDAETDTYIEIAGLNYFVSDQPLSLRAEPIRVVNQPVKQ